ncbi:hypothetical protein TNCV_1223581 [Trichonephila clavipes]|nr:hypothetical protein TNCV_1223581 [Trichonephila clavipes]
MGGKPSAGRLKDLPYNNSVKDLLKSNYKHEQSPNITYRKLECLAFISVTANVASPPLHNRSVLLALRMNATLYFYFGHVSYWLLCSTVYCAVKVDKSRAQCFNMWWCDIYINKYLTSREGDSFGGIDKYSCSERKVLISKLPSIIGDPGRTKEPHPSKVAVVAPSIHLKNNQAVNH